MNTDQNFSVSTHGSEQSLKLGESLSKILQLGDVVELVGDLGGGKTTLTKGIAAGLGLVETVTSPTYNIQRSYKIPTGGMLEHYDLYRLGDDEILLDEMREVIEAKDAIIVVEWADHFQQHLIEDRFVVNITFVDDETREIKVEATGPSTSERLAKLEYTA